jgi:hypothetical protein
MQFTVAGRTFPVRISAELLYDAEGADAWAVIDPVVGEILIWQDCPRAEWLHTLRYEFHRMWSMYNFPPEGQTHGAMNFANEAGEFDRQFAEQGGVAKLLSMTSHDDLPPEPPKDREDIPKPAVKAEPQQPRTDRRDCKCGETMMCGSFVTGKRIWSKSNRIWRCQRYFICDACGGVNVWWEKCDAEGEPEGQLLDYPAPDYYLGERARIFLRTDIAMPLIGNSTL